MPVTSYSTTAASNNSASPNGAPEGMAPSAVNDVIRQIMADIAVEAQTNNVKVLKTIAGTNTITADMDPELAAYVAGMIAVFTPANSNTGAVTIAIDGLTALDIQKGNAVPLIAGDLVAGVPAMLLLDSGADDFILMNPQTLMSGSFTATLTGMASATTGTMFYERNGNLVTLWLGNPGITGTSNTTAMTLTGLPAVVQPSNPKYVHCPELIDNSSVLAGEAYISGSTIAFSPYITNGTANRVQPNSVAFTNSGTKGLNLSWSLTYSLA